MEKFSLNPFFYRNISHYIKKCICILLMFTISFCFSAKIIAEESSLAKTSKSGLDRFESRIAKTEPDFFFSGSSYELRGFYFGVGFRNVSLLVTDDVHIYD